MLTLHALGRRRFAPSYFWFLWKYLRSGASLIFWPKYWFLDVRILKMENQTLQLCFSNRPYAYDVIISLRPPLGDIGLRVNAVVRNVPVADHKHVQSNGLYPQCGGTMTSMHKVYCWPLPGFLSQMALRRVLWSWWTRCVSTSTPRTPRTWSALAPCCATSTTSLSTTTGTAPGTLCWCHIYNRPSSSLIYPPR